MAGINIDIAANVRDFQRGTSDAEKGLDQVSDALDALARGSEQSAREAGDDLGKGIKDGAKDAAKAVDKLGDDMGDSVKKGANEVDQETEKLERSFKELADTAKRETSDLGDPMAISTRKGVDDAKEGLGEFKDEANSTARESAASFDGSAESIGDAFQEIAANAFAGFGPAGAVAGLAVAAGLGLAFAKIQEGAEDTEAFKERVSELGQAFIEAGRQGEVNLDFVVDKLKELATATGDGETSLQDLNDIAEKANSSYEDLAKAFTGNVEGIDKLISKNEDLLQTTKDQLAADQEGLAQRDRAYSSGQTQGLETYIDYLKQSRDAAQQATEQQKLFADAGGPAMEAAAQAASSYAESVQGAYADAGAAIDDYVEDGVFNLERYTAESQKQADAINAYQANMVALSAVLSDEALNYIASLGPEAAPLIDAFVKAPLDKQQATADVWARLGATSSSAFSTRVQNDLSGSSFNANVNLRANPQQIIDALASRRYDIAVNARVQNNIASQLPAGQGMGVP